MIVRQFLMWIQTAPPEERADATSALARAYLYSELSSGDRLAAEAAMTVLLDDPSVLVRRALAESLASSEYAPRTVLLGLTQDQLDIAEIVAERSPALLDVELVDLAASGKERLQLAIASRALISRAVAAAIAEVGSASACLVLLENPAADLTGAALARIAERHGHLAVIRDELLAREDLPTETRQALVAILAETLARFVTHKEWLPEARAKTVAREACDRATVAIAAGQTPEQVAALVRHLAQTGQLTGALLMRALLSGNTQFLIDALSELSGLSARRISSILSDRSGHGFRALFEKAGLPQGAYGAFRAAIEVVHEMGFGGAPGYSALGRGMVEQVIARYAPESFGELDELYALLRRFAAEAARDEARHFTADLVAAA
ncbi:MAG: DUF2336 domain-containing protein [Xanthobacteraceae bacterium]|nr:DUF2336 domain-containing protein [Xanthobacteraceae bacterium]MBX3548115.1 DUF2336 domain-containing protein [Xanthobacteraceae bacterium]MCW5679444.1 DUF2336 domain-containing protein [Xanthobacteraceae bacterium]